MIPWSHRCSAGFTIRGECSGPAGKPMLHVAAGEKTGDPDAF
jgi:hypothetical protein